MGAQYQEMTLDGSLSRAEVKAAFEKAQDQDRYDNGHSYSGGFGMADGLEFSEKTFERISDAHEYLTENCQKWEAARCVLVSVGEKGTWVIGAWCSS